MCEKECKCDSKSCMTSDDWAFTIIMCTFFVGLFGWFIALAVAK